MMTLSSWDCMENSIFHRLSKRNLTRVKVDDNKQLTRNLSLYFPFLHFMITVLVYIHIGEVKFSYIYFIYIYVRTLKMAAESKRSINNYPEGVINTQLSTIILIFCLKFDNIFNRHWWLFIWNMTTDYRLLLRYKAKHPHRQHHSSIPLQQNSIRLGYLMLVISRLLGLCFYAE